MVIKVLLGDWLRRRISGSLNTQIFLICRIQNLFISAKCPQGKEVMGNVTAGASASSASQQVCLVKELTCESPCRYRKCAIYRGFPGVAFVRQVVTQEYSQAIWWEIEQITVEQC